MTATQSFAASLACLGVGVGLTVAGAILKHDIMLTTGIGLISGFVGWVGLRRPSDIETPAE
jgi:hypothetical protein